MAQIVLSRSGLFPHVRVFRDAEQVLEVFRAWDDQDPAVFPPRVILLDINMPGMDGFQLLDALEELLTPAQGECMAVLMLTSSTRTTDRGRSEAHAMVKGFETKPLTDAAAARIVERFGLD